MSHFDEIMELSRQHQRGGLSPWFERSLRRQIDRGDFPDPTRLKRIGTALVSTLQAYREQTGVATAVLGISGGVDSALTAALLRHAGWRVVGHTLPINQNPEETERGVETCEALGLEHVHLDLSEQHRAMVAGLGAVDPDLVSGDEEAHRTRRGNIAARLRMITLYDQAHRHGGLVTSTDNFSELGAGFWTLNGDVGDVAPVQSLLKSWEVPWLAREYGVPERTWRAKPTDGLGIGEGDEAQIGASYLEWDIAVFALIEALTARPISDTDAMLADLGLDDDPHARETVTHVARRLRRTWFKRMVPIRLDHPDTNRFGALDALEVRQFRPAVVLRGDESLVRFTVDLQELAERLAQLLHQKNMRVVTAESCTSGLLGAALAKVPSSSDVFEGAFTTYTTGLKQNLLGVPEELIATHTAYSSEVAAAMARGALDRAPEAELALSVTGVGGPEPAEGRPPGLVYVCAARRGAKAEVEEHHFEGHPQQVLAAAIRAALILGARVAGG